MRKIIALITLLSLIFTLVACGQQSGDPNSDPNKITESTVEPDKLNSIPFVDLAPGNELSYPSEFIAFTDDAWLDYRITYSRASLTLIIGLRAEDGKEYSVEITGGDGNDKITGIPAGSYTIFVRSSESNSGNADTTTESLNVTGCMNFVLGMKIPEGATYYGKGQ